MTQEMQAPQIEGHHYYMLTPGEVRTFEHGNLVVKVFAVGGGSFTRLETRTRDGDLLPERSDTFQFETDAIRAYVAVLQWLVKQ